MLFRSRDLKPANLYVTRRADGTAQVKVLDFGIAKAAGDLRLTPSTTLIGSPGYMSPEQLISPRDVDARTDLWSLGVTLYQLISGRLPFPSSQLAEYTVMATTTEPPPLGGPLQAIVQRCLAKDRAARFPDVAALAAALVPFGGPSAASVAALVGAALPSPEVHAAADLAAPTLASVAVRAEPAMPPRAVARPRRWWLAALGVLLLGASGFAAWALVRSARSGTVRAPIAIADAGAADPKVAVADAAQIADAAVVAIATPTRTADAGARTPRIPSRDAAPTASEPTTKPTAEPRTEPPKTARADDRSANEAALKQLEQQMVTFANDPQTLVTVYTNAVTLSCLLGDVAKAKKYLAKVTDDDQRMTALGVCYSVKIKLE